MKCSTLREAKLQLVDDGFNDGALAEEQTVIQRHQSLLHVALELGDELDACGLEQLFCQLLRDIAFVRKHCAQQLLQQFWHRGRSKCFAQALRERCCPESG